MDGNEELLTYIHQNAQMGVRTIEHLLTLVEEVRLTRQLRSQRDGYQHFQRRAKEQLRLLGRDQEGLSPLEKAKTYLMIQMDTLTDRSSAHIAEMLITGSNMGILDAAKRIRQYPHARGDVVALVKGLSAFEEDNVQKLKAFL